MQFLNRLTETTSSQSAVPTPPFGKQGKSDKSSKLSRAASFGMELGTLDLGTVAAILEASA